MEVVSYNSELAIANLLFKRIFSNIHISRTNAQGQRQDIPVICTLEQRSRIMKNWENAEKRATYRLPMITINRTGYQRNPERVSNNNNEVKFEITSRNRSENLLTPVPIDINYEVSIIAKYPSDIDQIASNFMVFFNNDIFVSCTHPKYDGIKMNNQIVMEDSISEEHSGEIDGSTDDFITATFNFIFKTYLFGGTKHAKVVPEKMLSVYTGTYLSTYVYEFKNTAELLSYLNENGEAINSYGGVSCTMNQKMEGTLSTYVDNPQASAYIFDDGLVPYINEIQFDYYVVNETSADYSAAIQEINNYPLSAQHYFADKMVWVIKRTI